MTTYGSGQPDRATVTGMDSFAEQEIGAFRLSRAGKADCTDVGVCTRLLSDGTLLVVRHVGVPDRDVAPHPVRNEIVHCADLLDVPEFAARLARVLRLGTVSVLAVRVSRRGWQAWLSGCARLWDGRTGAMLTPGVTLGELAGFSGGEGLRLVATTGIGGGRVRGATFRGDADCVVGALAFPTLEFGLSQWPSDLQDAKARLSAIHRLQRLALRGPGVVLAT